MTRAAPSIALALLLLPAGADALPYLEGSVNHIRRENGDLYSAGSTRCFTSWGNEYYDCLILGQHFIHESSSGAWLLGRDYQVVFEYNDYVRSAPDPGICYRARINGTPPGGNTSAWGAAEICAPPEQTPPPPGTTGGPINQDGFSSPIVLDLDQGGFQFTLPGDGVRFDLDADGFPEQVAWTAARSADGFLALDRNANGRIDNGSELFGDRTPQPPSSEPNGFLALIALDDLLEGGDLDGAITERDTIYSRLLVWIDRDHDAESDSEELSSSRPWVCLVSSWITPRRGSATASATSCITEAAPCVDNGSFRSSMSFWQRSSDVREARRAPLGRRLRTEIPLEGAERLAPG